MGQDMYWQDEGAVEGRYWQDEGAVEDRYSGGARYLLARCIWWREKGQWRVGTVVGQDMYWQEVYGGGGIYGKSDYVLAR